MDAPLRIGLLGCGRIARMFHLPALAAMSDVTVTALADADEEQLAAARTTVPAAHPYADYRTLVDDSATTGGLDAVVVCLPTHRHAAAAQYALAAGLPVYVEKPLATSLEEAGEVVEAWRRSGLVGMVGFNFRFHPLHLQARSVIADGTHGGLGNLVAARMVFCSAPRQLPGWKQARVTGGGVLLDLCSHQADTVRFLLEREVESVTATIRSVRTEADTAAVTLRLTGDLSVQLLASMSAPQTDRIEVYGDEASLVIDRFGHRHLLRSPAQDGDGRADRLRRGLSAALRATAHVKDVLAPPPELSFATALSTFVAAVRTGRHAAPTLADGYASLQVVCAAEEAAATGRVVPVQAGSLA